MNDRVTEKLDRDDRDDNDTAPGWRGDSADEVIARYKAGVRTLLDHCEKHRTTGSAMRCARVVLGCWNGPDHPIDLTGVDSLDRPLRDAAIDVLVGHALTGREAHRFGEEARIRALATDLRPKRRIRR